MYRDSHNQRGRPFVGVVPLLQDIRPRTMEGRIWRSQSGQKDTYCVDDQIYKSDLQFTLLLLNL